MDTEKKEGRGMQLLDAIENQGAKLGLTIDEVAEKLGFTESYFKTFRRGQRWIGAVGHAKLEKIAEFVQLPLGTVYVMAGVLKPTDFVLKSTLTAKLDEAFQNIKNNPLYGPLAPSSEDWLSTPESVRYLTVLMYERLINEELLDRGERAIRVPVRELQNPAFRKGR